MAEISVDTIIIITTGEGFFFSFFFLSLRVFSPPILSGDICDGFESAGGICHLKATLFFSSLYAHFTRPRNTTSALSYRVRRRPV